MSRPAADARAAVEWTTYASPVGRLRVVECEAGPLLVAFEPVEETLGWHVRVRGALPEVRAVRGRCARTVAWLDAYFAGPPLPRRWPWPDWLRDWWDVTPAQVAVWRALRGVPVGATVSYQDLARVTGLIPRQVGHCMATNRLAILLPCHRVVGKDGRLVGYAGGLPAKRWLLAHELRAAGVRLS